MAGRIPEPEKYPRRGAQYWANRYMTHVLRSSIAMEFGCQAVALLFAVALTEDKTRYSKAVLFWNDQLTAYLGCRVDRLNEIRSKLVDAGWLHYEPGRKSVAGRYWVLVPGGNDELNDTPLGDNAADSPAENFPYGKAHTKADDKAHHKAPDNAHHKPSTFIPIPEPVPSSTPKPPPDERGEVEKRLKNCRVDRFRTAVATAAGNGLTPEQSHAVINYFEAAENAGKWMPAALFHRLTQPEAAHLPPDRGWPTPNDTARRQLATNRHADVQRREHAEREAKAKQHRAELDRFTSPRTRRFSNRGSCPPSTSRTRFDGSSIC